MKEKERSLIKAVGFLKGMGKEQKGEGHGNELNSEKAD